MAQVRWQAFGTTPKLYPPPHDAVSLPISTDKAILTTGLTQHTASSTGEVRIQTYKEYGRSEAKHTPRRRDSLHRREALLKGRENTRRRQKWENDRLMHNPWAQPPEPGDFAPQATHPVRDIPYALASLWDERNGHGTTTKSRILRANEASRDDCNFERVARELRATFRKARSAKGLLIDLEDEVRKFLTSAGATENAERHPSEGLNEKDDSAQQECFRHDSFSSIDSYACVDSGGHEELYAESLASDEDNEDIVFVGRVNDNNKRDFRGALTAKTASALPNKQHDLEMSSDTSFVHQKMMIETPSSNGSAKFVRYLLHNLADYYNLVSWSVSRGDPEVRAAYIGVKLDGSTPALLPQPLWCRV